jgi:hypothetical protein
MAEEEQGQEEQQEQVKDNSEVEELRAELERFKAKHKEQEKHLKAKEKAEREAQEEAARKSGDVKSLEASWQAKMEQEIATREARIAATEARLSQLTVGQTAQKLAAELAIQGSADVLLPHIAGRLRMEQTDGGAVVRVLDKDGKPSAATIDDLKKEIEANKAFAPLLVGSRASGGGAPGWRGEPKVDMTGWMPEDKMEYARSTRKNS